MIRKRLDALKGAIRPPHSIAARVETLTPEQRSQWDRHQQRLAEWNKRFASPADAFEAMLNGDMPELRHDIREAIYGPTPVITKGMTVEQAAAIYDQVKGIQCAIR